VTDLADPTTDRVQDRPAGTSPGAATVPFLPALVDGHVGHARHGPFSHAFRHRLHLWLVDVDDLPRRPWWLRPLASFSSRDHFATTPAHADESIATKTRRFLHDRGIDLDEGGRVVMLANARVLGHVFDPLSVFWCFDGDGELRCVVAEVHNTYGERHAYLLLPDAEGRATTGKQMYVSPFNDTTGSYRLRFALSAEQVRVDVALVRAGEVVFDAFFTGTPTPATTAAVVCKALRSPVMPQRVSALIRLHGIWLWLRGLPVVPRPRHRTQEDR
jgi:uncharacterized protein